MILALEGVDRVGKSTTHAALQKLMPKTVKFISSLPVTKELLSVMPQVELRQASLWEQMYDNTKLYVCDRHFAVTGQVYNRLYNRPTIMDCKRWYSELYIAYLWIPTHELERRFAESPDHLFDCERVKEVVTHYEDVLASFPNSRILRVDATRDTDYIATRIAEWVL